MSHSDLVPEPVQDELVFGYLGRIQFLNDIPSFEETLRRIKARQRIASDRDSTPVLVYLARELGIADEQLAARHTMAPLFNTVTRIDAHRPHWTPAQTALRRFGAWGSTVYRMQAQSCPVCGEDDRRTHGVGIWRRSHQLPGVDFCHRHSVRLQVHGDFRAFRSPPPRVGARGNSCMPNQLALRYTDICENFLSQPVVQHIRDLRPRVLEHLHLHGRPSDRNCADNEPVLPGVWDFIRARHLPSCNQSFLNLPSLSFLEIATAFDATNYAIALSLIFESSAEAIRFHQEPGAAVQRFVEGAQHQKFWACRQDQLLTALATSSPPSEVIAKNIQTLQSSSTNRPLIAASGRPPDGSTAVSRLIA